MHYTVFVELIAEIFFCFAISAMSSTRAMKTFEIPVAMSAVVFMIAGMIQYVFLCLYLVVGLFSTI